VCVCVSPTITLECLNWFSGNFICISCHMRPPLWCMPQIPPISNTNIEASQILEEITLILLACIINYHETWHVWGLFGKQTLVSC
jgi:hypothetical protein